MSTSSHLFYVEDIFLRQASLRRRHFLRQAFPRWRYFLRQVLYILQQEIFTPSFFTSKTFSTPSFFTSKTFLRQAFLHQRQFSTPSPFYVEDVFYAKSFLRRRHFLHQALFTSKTFSTPSHFYVKNISVQSFTSKSSICLFLFLIEEDQRLFLDWQDVRLCTIDAILHFSSSFSLGTSFHNLYFIHIFLHFHLLWHFISYFSPLFHRNLTSDYSTCQSDKRNPDTGFVSHCTLQWHFPEHKIVNHECFLSFRWIEQWRERILSG